MVDDGSFKNREEQVSDDDQEKHDKAIKAQISSIRERSRVITLMMEDCAEMNRKRKESRIHRRSEPMVLDIIDQYASQIIMLSIRIIMACAVLTLLKYCFLYS